MAFGGSLDVINVWDWRFDSSADGDAHRFLAALGKNGATRIRGFFHSDNPKKKDDRGRKATLNAHTIWEWQKDGRGVYAVIGNGGDTKAEIESIPAFFCEWDDRPLEEQLNFDWSGFIRPSIQIPTQKSSHNYWPIDGGTTDIPRWESIQIRMNRVLGADESIKDPSRVMRLPGCHYADGNGDLVKYIGFHHFDERKFTVDEFDEALSRFEKERGIEPPASKAFVGTNGSKRQSSWISDLAREQLKIDGARPKEQVLEALKLWPPRVPGNGTYDGTQPVKNSHGQMVKIDYFQTAVGCFKALIYAGVDEEEAFELIQDQHPQWGGLRQNLESSGGAGPNGRPIEDSSFWRTAFDQFGWVPSVVAEDTTISDMAVAAGQLKQNRITAAESFELMTVLPRSLALPFKSRAETFPVHESALFAPFCSAFASTLGKRVMVQPKLGHTEPLCFWFANVQPMSSMKSPVGKEVAYYPLERINRLDARRYASQVETLGFAFAIADECGITFSKALETKEDDPEAWAKLCKQAGSTRYKSTIQRKVRAYISNPENGVFPPRSAVTKDATVEKLCELLALPNNHGLLLYFDELVEFMESMDQYRLAGGDRQKYLDLWSGSAINTQRKGANLVSASKTCLNLFGYIQPEKLRELLAQEKVTVSSGGDGFWPRWLFCNPPNTLGLYNDLEGSVEELLQDCLDRADKGVIPGTILKFAPDAFALYKGTVNKWLVASESESLMVQGFTGKIKGYLARFAGLLHCIEWSQREEEHLGETISAETMLRAVHVCEYFRRQFNMVMSQAGATGIPAWVTRLELKVETTSTDQITASDLSKWRIADSAEDANEKIKQLVDDLGWGDKRRNRQKNWVWLPRALNPHQVDEKVT